MQFCSQFNPPIRSHQASALLSKEDAKSGWFREKVDEWIVKYPTYRKFIFECTNQKMNDLLSTFDSISFMNTSDRLYKYLVDLSNASGSSTITKSHQQIAIELNTSRVVISRLMKHLSGAQLISQERNKVELL